MPTSCNSVCTCTLVASYEAIWGKFVICENELYKINWIELMTLALFWKAQTGSCVCVRSGALPQIQPAESERSL